MRAIPQPVQVKNSRDPALRRRFGVVLRQARRQRNVTQEELAARGGLDVSFISRVERGLQAPSLEVIAALATALGTKAHLLVLAAELDEEK